MLDAIARMAFTEDARTGSVLLWSDTLASLTRMALGIAGPPWPAWAWASPPAPFRCCGRPCRP